MRNERDKHFGYLTSVFYKRSRNKSISSTPFNLRNKDAKVDPRDYY